MTLPRLLTTRDAAEALGVTEDCLGAWRLRGLGPRYRKIGRLVRYAESDLETFLVDATRGPNVHQHEVSTGRPLAENCGGAACEFPRGAQSDRGPR